MQWNLIKLRKESGLSQKQIAKILKITEESYGSKERGQNQFKSNEMFILSHFFQLPIDQIFLPPDFGNTEEFNYIKRGVK